MPSLLSPSLHDLPRHADDRPPGAARACERQTTSESCLPLQARKPCIAAVIVTRDRPALLAKAIAALQAQTRQCDAFYIVDNASASPTIALLQPLDGCDRMTVLRSEINLGGTGGFSLGLQRACADGHDWVWLLDDDAIARPQALAALCDALALLPADVTGALCGAVREFDRLAVTHRRVFSALLGLERCFPEPAYAGLPVAIDTGSFVGFLVSARAVEAVGLPESAFFLAYDDTDYSLRLKRAGFGLWLVPNSIVDHLRLPEGRLRATAFERKHYFNIRNRIVVRRRHARLPALAALCASVLGLGLLLAGQDRFQPNSWRILLRAIGDGWHERLGGYPDTLATLAPWPSTANLTP